MADYTAGRLLVRVIGDLRGVSQQVQREFRGLGPYQVPIKADVDKTGLAGLDAAIAAIPDIVLDADASPAERELSELRARMETLRDQRIGIDISAADAKAEVASIKDSLDRLGAESPDIRVRVDTGAASAALTNVSREVDKIDGQDAQATVSVDMGGALASLASLGAQLVALNGLSVSPNINIDATQAIGAIAAVTGKAFAVGGAVGGIAALGAALIALGPAAAVAGGGLVTMLLAFSGVGKALGALNTQQDQAAQTAQQSAQQQAAAARQVESAQLQLTRATTTATQTRAEAARNVARAEEQAAKQVQQAQQQAAKQIAAADKQVESAHRTLQRATTDLAREQRALTTAWTAGQRALEDLQDQVDGNALDQRQAAFDLQDARKALDEARASGDADQIGRAQLAYDRQLETIDQLNKQTQRLGVDNRKAQAGGVAGTEQYQSALDRVNAAAERQRDAIRGVRDADAAAAAARIEGANAVAAAQEAGRQRVADAVEQGQRQIAAADQAVQDAQRALQTALAQTGTAGQTAANNVATAFANLSPAAAAFARYLWSLKPAFDELRAAAAEGFFPPVQAGLAALMGQFGLFRTVVGQFAAAMGGALGYILTQLASPFWTGFFATLGNVAGPLMTQLAVVFMQVAQAVAQVILALLPFTPAALGVLSAVAGLIGVLAPFIGQLVGALIPAAYAVVAAFLPLGPVLAALGPILAVLAQAFAMVLGAVLQALAPILVALTPLITQLAMAFAQQLVAAITALTPFLVGLATFMSQHPGLVLAVIGVLAGLWGAWQGLHRIVTLLLGPLMLMRLGLMALGLSATTVGAAVGGVATTIAGFVARIAGSFSFMALARTLLGLVGGAIRGIGMAVLSAMGPIGWIITALGLMYTSSAPFRDAVNQLLAVLGQLIGQLVGALMPVFQAVMDAFMLIVNAGVMPLVQQLAAALVPILNTVAGVLGQLVAAILPPFQQLFAALTPVIMLVAQVVVQLLQALMPLIQVALMPLMLQMRLWSGLMTALMPVIAMLVEALSGALVWVLQTLVVPALEAMAWVITSVIAPAITWLAGLVGPALTGIGTTASWLGGVWSTVWNAIATAVNWAWTTILQPIFNAIGLAARVLFAVVATVLLTPLMIAWNLLMAAMQWAWESILLPCWQAIQTAANWLWTNVLQPVFTAVSIGWNALLIGMNMLWVNILQPCWMAIQAAATWLWLTILQPTFNAIGIGWQALLAGINYLWLTVLKPCWDAIIAALNWLHLNVWVPIMNGLRIAWQGLADGINWVWLNIIKPAWDAVAGGLMWLRDRFNDAVTWIGDIWNRIRGLLAKPINFMIDVVWNRGVVPAWNAVAGLVGLGPVQPLPLIPEFASGGRVQDGMIRGPGNGTSDSIGAITRAGNPLKVSNREFIVRESVTRRTLPFLRALNSGDGEALQAAGGTGAARGVKQFHGTSGLGMNPMVVRPPGLAGGGLIEERIAAAKSWLSGPARGAPYVYGGGTNPRRGMDCSSMQSAVTHILSGRPPDSGRIGATSTMPWGGFVGGLNGAYAIGNKPNDHMAGTLAGQNVEQHGPDGTPFSFPSRWGADNGYFPQKYHLGEVGGQFVSGGAGGGAGFNPIRAAIEAVFGPLKDALVGAVTGLVGPPPPEWRRVPPAFTGKAVDALRDFLLSKADAFGGGAMGATSDEAPAIVKIISDVAKSRFGGLARDAAIIGVATGLVESDLRNLAGGDRDSVGVFQQRPSQGWGTVEQCRNVTYAAGKFFSRFPGNWHSMNPGALAQSVQRSAYPDRYGQRMGQARGLVQQFGGFHEGGVAGRGQGIMLKTAIPPERVLDPVETRDYDTLGPLVREMEAGRLPAPGAGVSARQIEDMASGRRDELAGLRISGHMTLDPDMTGGFIDGRIDDTFGALAGITPDRS